MDFESIKNQVSNLSLYDLKAGVRKVQNAVMNYTEMEAKVREATNNEPWGASSTLMQDIANGTFNYSTLNEIMPMIYRRFTEKAAEEWRQIYKALQLLEFLIKNGSERVIDDARSHLSLLKMLKQFHFIDHNGKDQGLNVRNRAKELTELLSDVDRIRSERKKSRQTRNKYGGVEGGSGLGMSSGSFGGMRGEDSYGGYSGGVYGDGGGFGGNSSHFSDTQGRRDRFEEYDEYDEGAVASPTTSSRRREPASGSSSKRAAAKPEPPAKKEPEVDLFSFGDDDIAPPPAPPSKSPTANNNFSALSGGDDDDDFDDFQSAVPSSGTQQPITSLPPPGQFAPPPSAGTQSLFAAAPQTTSPPPSQPTPNYAAFATATAQAPTLQPQTATMQPQSATPQAPRPTGYMASQPNYFGSVSVAPAASTASTPGTSGAAASGYKPSLAPGAKKPAGGDPFAMLAGGGLSKKSGAGAQKGPTMADLSKQKAQAGIWGAPAASSASGGAPAQSSGGGGGFNDLLG